ncbi:hypothetical protein PoB_007639700 [Plakobranchus ocellatus]|uniref:Uncharacterized protein n=1 Tax=Plakobranchus ocellatus TaxID=259542 RepID=A0AAV4DZU3_9GAST|nr:hypothetical protein PoB_007639700 [Plakobranchus ocellatus]
MGREKPLAKPYRREEKPVWLKCARPGDGQGETPCKTLQATWISCDFRQPERFQLYKFAQDSRLTWAYRLSIEILSLQGFSVGNIEPKPPTIMAANFNPGAEMIPACPSAPKKQKKSPTVRISQTLDQEPACARSLNLQHNQGSHEPIVDCPPAPAKRWAGRNSLQNPTGVRRNLCA